MTTASLVGAPRRFSSPGELLADVAAVVVSASSLVRAFRGGVPPALRERVIVAVSRANACSGCSRVHEQWALRSGVTDDELRAIGVGDLAALDEESRAAVVYATQRAERRFRGSATSEAEGVARAQLSPDRVEQIDAIARAIALANLSLNTVSALACAVKRPAGGHPVFARVCELIASRAVAADDRAELVAGLRGEVVEIGAGSGSNFAHYPPTVDSVLAVEPESYLRRRAERAARQAAVSVTVIDATAEALPALDDSCDAAVACLVLCSVPDQAAALAELRRVLRPGGELRFYEHVVAHSAPGASVQLALDRSGIWPRLGAGCHLARDTAAAIEQAGFVIEGCRRVSAGLVPHVAGVARKSAAQQGAADGEARQ
jgi:AhpD family alkylhydroperoxidase